MYLILVILAVKLMIFCIAISHPTSGGQKYPIKKPKFITKKSSKFGNSMEKND
jgi:hypothetical protein